LRRSALALAFACAACNQDFSLGSWGATPAPSTMPTATATASAMPSATATATATTPPAQPPTCLEAGTPGPINAQGMGGIGTTTLTTDWSWPQPVDSLTWDLVVENDPKTDGYYWAHKFTFVGGLTGFFGMQAHGGYVDPNVTPTAPCAPNNPTHDPGCVDFTKMMVFWIAGPPAQAMLGDIPEPDARTSVQMEGGIQWMTIHARYDWTACVPYRLRVAKYRTEDTGDIWYGAWILDGGTAKETFIGAILVPAAWGQIAKLSTTLTTRIDQAPPPVMTCADPEYVSAIFGTPTGNDGQVLPAAPANSFSTPLRCPSSRFTNLADGVRHEIGIKAGQ
jgi:hypothetical protein